MRTAPSTSRRWHHRVLSIGSLAFGFNDFTFTRLQGLQNGTYTLVSSGAPINGMLDGNDLSGPIGNGGSGKLQISSSGTNIELVVSLPPYTSWSNDTDFGDDTNGDGVSNGMAYLLGAEDVNVDANSLLPVVTESGGGLVLNFKLLKAASRGTAALQVMHSDSLGNPGTWTEVAVPETSGGPFGGVTFIVSENVVDSEINDVKATISSSEAVVGKLFGRLKATD